MMRFLKRTGLTQHLAVLAVVAVGSAGLSGCGADDADAASDDAITLEHGYGETVVEPQPERIVSLDGQWTDTMLAMGVDPVGYRADRLMPGGNAPWWDTDTMEGERLELEEGVPYEQIAALEPDLILGSYSVSSQEIYDKLSGIAPTITAPENDNSVESWQQMTSLAGDFLEEPEAAEDLIASVESEVSGVAKDLPGLRGKTFALAQYIVGDGMVVVADKSDGSSVLFEQLGLDMLPALVKEYDKTGNPRVEVSTERVDLLGSDLLAFLVNGGDESDLADIPGFDQLPASRTGAAAVLDYASIVAMNTPSALSTPYALKQLRPYLEAAAR